MAIPSSLQFARQHVGLFRERYTQTSYSSPRTRRLELSKTLAWSAAVSLDHRCTLDWPTAPYAHNRPQGTDVYSACRTAKRVLAALARNGTPRRNRDRRATISPPPYPRTLHRLDFRERELAWCARVKNGTITMASYVRRRSRLPATTGLTDRNVLIERRTATVCVLTISMSSPAVPAPVLGLTGWCISIAYNIPRTTAMKTQTRKGALALCLCASVDTPNSTRRPARPSPTIGLIIING